MEPQRVRELIVVPGHAPFRRFVKELPERLDEDDPWFLAPFQAGEPPLYLGHIHAALQLAREKPRALIVFSGGVTREAGGWSEAATYRAVAVSLLAPGDELQERLETETAARDSWENLLLSILRFHQAAETYPAQVSVVGWGFKRERFEQHRASIDWPADRFRYVGVNDPAALAEAEVGEARTLAEFGREPFGARGPLAQKRRERSFGLPPANDEHRALLAYYYGATRDRVRPPWS